MSKIVVITGAGAGVGRATVGEFARHGYDIALLSRDSGRLEEAAAEARACGVRALPISTDVADAEAVEAAATRVEEELGPIDVWVNVAMATVFSPVAKLTAKEVARGTAVTYLGQVHGMMAALRRMTPRNRGYNRRMWARPSPTDRCRFSRCIVAPSSPFVEFTNSLRSEILHDELNIKISMVDLPAVNTPQFSWALNKTGHRAQPVPPIFQPEIPARAIYFAAVHPRRQSWIGFPTVKAILANRIAPGIIDRYLASAGYSGQLENEPLPDNAPNNLFEAVPGPYGAHGRFDQQARDHSWEAFISRHRNAVWAIVAIGALLAIHRVAKRLHV